MKSKPFQWLSALLLTGFLLIGMQSAVYAAKPPAPANAPAPAFVIPIEIRAHAYDAIGTALIQRTQDNFASDRRFKVVTSAEPSRVVIHISTQASKNNKEPVTAYGLAVTFKLPDNPDRIFAGNTVGVCSMKEVPVDAKGIVDMTWTLVENFTDLMNKVKQPVK